MQNEIILSSFLAANFDSDPLGNTKSKIIIIKKINTNNKVQSVPTST